MAGLSCGMRLQRMRDGAIFSSDFNAIPPVQSSPQKHSASRLPQISTTTAAVSSLNEGRIAIVTDVGMGCGGRGSVGRERGCRAGLLAS